MIAGRGGGKESIASLLATVAAINFDPHGKLRPGEKGFVIALATDRHQAGILFNYIRGYFEEIPALNALVTAIDSDHIGVCNDVNIKVHTNSFRAVRGRSILCALLDECAFFRDENFALPDAELHAALSPGLARVPGSMKILNRACTSALACFISDFATTTARTMTIFWWCTEPRCNLTRALTKILSSVRFTAAIAHRDVQKIK